MKLDLNLSIIDQVEEFKIKTGNVDKSAREFTDEDLISFVDMFITNLDYGEHSNNTINHKIMAYEDIAQKILNNVETTKLHIQEGYEKFESIEELNKYVMKYVYFSHMYQCRFCGERFKTEYKQGGYLTAIDEIKYGHFANHYPPKKECYKEQVVKIRIKMKSNKFVIANDLRGSFKDESIGFDDDLYDICTPLGRINCAKEFAKKDMICVNTGNTTIEVWKNKNGLVFTDMYYPDYEQYAFSDKFVENIKDVNSYIEDNKFKKGKFDTISCGLWWIMGASACDINISDISTDHVVYNVKKGTTYILEFEYHKGNFYKFYKEKLDEKDGNDS